ncbi:S-adenosylmethionine:tRNA ribosyltransferase-isomerase [Oryzihumus sp.]
MSVATVPELAFSVPEGALAAEPPEARGLRRDEVRLLVADGCGLSHARFHDLGRFLRAGDVLVINTSATLPAALPARRGGVEVTVHFAAEPAAGTWLVELRPGPRADGPLRDGREGERLDLPDGGVLRLLAPYPDSLADRPRIWRARVSLPLRTDKFLVAHGAPIAYAYVRGAWPISAYQTVFARDPGSAEMPSAGRPFSADLVSDLVAAGVLIAPVTLHTGVSSMEPGEGPLPERYAVPEGSAALVNLARARGGRVVAVGTTATRALETVAAPDGTVAAGAGWTDLVLGPDRPARAVDGIISGWHEPGASHLLLLEAVAGPDVVRRAYGEAVRERYLWHEFGDSALLLREGACGELGD